MGDRGGDMRARGRSDLGLGLINCIDDGIIIFVQVC